MSSDSSSTGQKLLDDGDSDQSGSNEMTIDEVTQKRIWASVLAISSVLGVALLIAALANPPQLAWMWVKRPAAPPIQTYRLRTHVGFDYWGTSIIFSAFAVAFIAAIKLFTLSDLYQKTEDD
jgi:hypothetical protein